MTTISVPLSPSMIEFIEEQIKLGNDENKVGVIRRALKLLAEEKAVQDILKSERELKEGKILRGDLRELMKKIK
ncbi:MAG: hypothetical protein NTV72_02145 [Candidatus Taylorbacteria bacterium]|nr:hypothetical protein [Candidatus Taylorbacteria bacterium]